MNDVMGLALSADFCPSPAKNVSFKRLKGAVGALASRVVCVVGVICLASSSFAETVENSFVTVEGEGVSLDAGGNICVDRNASGSVTVSARSGWSVNGREAVTGNPLKGTLRSLDVSSNLGEDSGHVHVFPYTEKDDHLPEEYIQIGAEVKPSNIIAIYAYPATSAVVSASATVKVLRKGKHQKTKTYSKCSFASCDAVHDPEEEVDEPYEVEPDHYAWTATAEGLSFPEPTWTGPMTNGLGKTIKFEVTGTRGACAKCMCETEAEAKADVFELHISRPDYLGLDMTDAMRGKYVTRSASAVITPDPASATYNWTKCGKCDFIGETNKVSVTYGATDETGPSDSYGMEKLSVDVTVRNEEGTPESTTCTTNFTVVQVDVSLDNWGELADELGLSKVPAFVRNARGRFSKKAYDNLSKHKVSVDIYPEGMPEDEIVSFTYGGNYVLENKQISDTGKCLFERVGSYDLPLSGFLELSVSYANHQYSIKQLADQSFSLLGTSVGMQEILAQHRNSEARDKVVYDVYCCRVTICADSAGGTSFNTLKDVGHAFWKLEIDSSHIDMIPNDLRMYACAYMGLYPAGGGNNLVLPQEGGLRYESRMSARHDSRVESGASGTAKHTWFVTIDDLIAGLNAAKSLENHWYDLAVFNCTDAALLVVNACGVGANWSEMGNIYKSPLELYHALTAVNGVIGGME